MVRVAFNSLSEKLQGVFKNLKGNFIKENSSFIHIQADEINFNIENEIIKNTLSLLIIKKIHKENPKDTIKNKPKTSYHRKYVDELSSNDKYRICCVSAFDMIDDDQPKLKRKFNEI